MINVSGACHVPLSEYANKFNQLGLNNAHLNPVSPAIAELKLGVPRKIVGVKLKNAEKS